MPVVNYFASPLAARLYAEGRPTFQPGAVERARRIVDFGGIAPWGLDIGCGTGRSTAALLPFVSRVVGVDIAPDMMRYAPQSEGRLFYAVARGEELPFASGVFGLVTVASAFHWLDRARFFPEARRVLSPGGHLLIYQDGFTAKTVEDDPLFYEWTQNLYARFPPPSRHAPFHPEKDAPPGFSFSGGDVFPSDVALSAEAFVTYLLSQSNFLAHLPPSDTNVLPALQAKLLAEAAPHWTNEKTGGAKTRRLLFRNVLFCLRAV